MAPEIVRAIGPHRAYWEPFCGSMAVLLAKPKATMETVNDLHGDLINLARCIQHPTEGPCLYRRLRRTWMHEVLFNEAASRVRQRGWPPASNTPDAERAYDFFVCSWFGRNGVAGTQSYNQGYCRRYTKNGGHGATRFAGAVDSIPAWRERMRGLVILEEDGIALCEKIEDAEGVVIYADPPYLVKGAKYIRDFTGQDHMILVEALARFRKTRVVVSYYDHPKIAELYPSWLKIDCTRTKSLVNQGMRDKKGSTEAPEVLLVNQRGQDRQLFDQL